MRRVTREMRSRERRGRWWRRGQAMVEFPAVILYWVGLTFGTASACLGVYAYSFTSQGARDGVRYAMVRGSDLPTSQQANQSSVSSYVISEAHGLSTSAITVTATWPTNNNPGSVVNVAVTYKFQPLYPFSSAVLPLSSSAQMVITY